MPYIKREDRYRLIPRSVEVAEAKSAGELNYQFTVLAIYYFQANGGNYQAINDVLGALEGAKLEFYRRIAAPYEETKIEQNGDVYPEMN